MVVVAVFVISYSHLAHAMLYGNDGKDPYVDLVSSSQMNFKAFIVVKCDYVEHLMDIKANVMLPSNNFWSNCKNISDSDILFAHSYNDSSACLCELEIKWANRPVDQIDKKHHGTPSWNLPPIHQQMKVRDIYLSARFDKVCFANLSVFCSRLHSNCINLLWYFASAL